LHVSGKDQLLSRVHSTVTQRTLEDKAACSSGQQCYSQQLNAAAAAAAAAAADIGSLIVPVIDVAGARSTATDS